jgi:hypothetical protein
LNVDQAGLTRYLANDADRSAPTALASLTAALQQRFGDALAVVLYYGSCMRTGEIEGAVVDLHVVIDDYGAYKSWPMAVLNRALAPNVFYLTTQADGLQLRCKYNVFALDHLPRLVSPGRLAVFTWARLAQRSAVLYARDDSTLSQVHALRVQAVSTFAGAAERGGADTSTARRFWCDALRLTFGCELRAESPARAQQVVEQDADYFEGVTEFLAPRPQPPGTAGPIWWLRRCVGKTGSVLRLVKGWYTFEGGLDYVVWKLERHSGQQITVPDRVRQRPALHIWGFAWRLYRDGVFR